MGVSSLFDGDVVNSTRNELGTVVLRADLSLTGPRGASLYEAWRALGNTGTLQDFLNYSEETVRPKFKIHVLDVSDVVVDEVPTDSEALAKAIAGDAKIGDLVMYETPMSVYEQTMGQVIYQWEVRENPAGDGYVLLRRYMNTPIYLRPLRTNEVSPGFVYKVDRQDGLQPSVWKVNGLGTPCEVYMNPSIDYGVIRTAYENFTAQILGDAPEGTTMGDVLEALAQSGATSSMVNRLVALEQRTSSDDPELMSYQDMVDELQALSQAIADGGITDSGNLQDQITTLATALEDFAINLAAQATDKIVTINNPKGNNANIPAATQTSAGVMTADDYTDFVGLINAVQTDDLSSAIFAKPECPTTAEVANYFATQGLKPGAGRRYVTPLGVTNTPQTVYHYTLFKDGKIHVSGPDVPLYTHPNTLGIADVRDGFVWREIDSVGKGNTWLYTTAGGLQDLDSTTFTDDADQVYSPGSTNAQSGIAVEQSKQYGSGTNVEKLASPANIIVFDVTDESDAQNFGRWLRDSAGNWYMPDWLEIDASIIGVAFSVETNSSSAIGPITAYSVTGGVGAYTEYKYTIFEDVFDRTITISGSSLASAPTAITDTDGTLMLAMITGTLGSFTIDTVASGLSGGPVREVNITLDVTDSDSNVGSLIKTVRMYRPPELASKATYSDPFELGPIDVFSIIHGSEEYPSMLYTLTLPEQSGRVITVSVPDMTVTDTESKAVSADFSYRGGVLYADSSAVELIGDITIKTTVTDSNGDTGEFTIAADPVTDYAIAEFSGTYSGAAQTATATQSANSRHTIEWEFEAGSDTGNSMSIAGGSAGDFTITYCPWSLQTMAAGAGWAYDLSDLPRGLTGFTSTSIANPDGVTGDVSDIPATLKSLWIANAGGVYGNLDNLAGRQMTRIRLQGASTTGDVSNFATNTETLYGNAGAQWTCSEVVAYRGTNKQVYYSPDSGGMSSEEVDRFLEGLATSSVSWLAPALVELTGANAVPGTASTEVGGWIDQLEANGATVTVNS